jgi:hypothetical protein
MSDREESLTTADIAQPQRESAEVRSDEAAREEGEAAASGQRAALEPLLAAEEAESFRSRWESIQTSFVDSPRQSVEQADALVAELMQRLAQTFSQEREGLESQWSRGDDVSTEDLRVGLQRYRSFFERLLST